MWNFALNPAVYFYKRTPHSSNDMISPLQKFKPRFKFNLKQLKRFDCIASIKIQRKTVPKFDQLGKRVVLIGYKPKGHLFLTPEEGKYNESRDRRASSTIFKFWVLKHKSDNITTLSTKLFITEILSVKAILPMSIHANCIAASN